MKLALALSILAISGAACAQQDLSSSNRDSTQNGVLSGTTTNSMRDDYGTQVPSTQPVAPSQTSATNNPVNVMTGTVSSTQPTTSAVNAAQQAPAPQPLPGAQPMSGTTSGTTTNGATNGTSSGTTQSPQTAPGR